MGLLQRAVETYDAHSSYVGKEWEGHQMLAPIGHIITRAELEIILDSDGSFLEARAVEASAPKILIPVTEESGGRTSAPCAHPLCDQLVYLAPYNEVKHGLYVAQLRRWAQSEYSHPMLTSILSYIEKGTILSNLASAGLIKLNEEGYPEKEKQMVRWRVLGVEGNSACWLNKDLFQSFVSWYQASLTETESELDMITGEMQPIAKQHPKGIIPINGNAKLISANDSSGFTYRGRFLDDTQAVTVSYVSSQKAHNALRWLAAEQGAKVVFGGRTFLCWNPRGRNVPQATGLFRRREKPAIHPSEYREDLQKALNGWRAQLPEEKEGVVIAAFDAATTGRLSLTYYNELMGSDFLQRLHEWDKWCCCLHPPYGIESPSLFQIANMAFGTLQKGKFETKDKVLREQMQRLVSCRVDCALIPTDIEQAIVKKASRLELYDDDKGGGYLRSEVLFTTCAVIRKYYHDHNKGELSMALEPETKDRSYQFGRLLAVMEKVERDTYDSNEGRETNAIRMQSIFCQRPLYAAGIIEKQLERAYYPRLKPGRRVFYKNLCGQILDIIHESPESEWNRPLKDTYLMGYYLQRNALYQSKKAQESLKNEEDENNE